MSDTENNTSDHPVIPSAPTPAPVEPKVACARAVMAACEMYSCDLVAVPEFRPDGRGGWYVTTRIDVIPRAK